MLKKIIIIGDGLSGRGGLETVVAKVYNQLPAHMPCEIKLILTERSGDQSWLEHIDHRQLNIGKHIFRQNWFGKIFIHGAIRNFLTAILKARQLKVIFDQLKPDMVISISHQLLPVLHRVRQSNQLNYDLIFWDHMAFGYYLQNKLYFRHEIKYADKFFSISSGIYDSYAGLMKKHQKNYLIYNPIDKKDRIIPEDTTPTTHFIYVGRLKMIKQKRVKDLLDAIALIKDQNFIVHFYGDDSSVDQVDSYVKQLGIERKVAFHGWQYDVWNNIKTTDALILCSSFEGFSMSICEALSYGIPCIGSDCQTGMRDLIKPDQNGLLFPVGDVSALAEQMLKVIHKTAVFDRQTVQNSVEFIHEDAYFKRFVTALEE